MKTAALTAIAVTLDFLGDLDLVLFLLLGLGLALAQLLGKLVNGQVDGSVKIVLGILGMKVRPRQRQVDLHLVILLLGTVLIEEQHHMGGNNAVGVLLQMGDLVGHMGMNGCGELEMTGAEVDLHGVCFF